MRCHRIWLELRSQRSDRPACGMCHLWDIKLTRKDKRDWEEVNSQPAMEVISELCRGVWGQEKMKRKDNKARKLNEASSKEVSLLWLFACLFLLEGVYCSGSLLVCFYRSNKEKLLGRNQWGAKRILTPRPHPQA